MKLRKGEPIVCSEGHEVGRVDADVPDGEPITGEALILPQEVLDNRRHGYVCGQCEEVVAWRDAGPRWRVRTARGWVS